SLVAVSCVALALRLPPDTTAVAPPTLYTLSLHDRSSDLMKQAPNPLRPTMASSLRIRAGAPMLSSTVAPHVVRRRVRRRPWGGRSEEHTSELQSLRHLVCRLLLEKKNGTGGTPDAVSRRS